MQGLSHLDSDPTNQALNKHFKLCNSDISELSEADSSDLM